MVTKKRSKKKCATKRCPPVRSYSCTTRAGVRYKLTRVETRKLAGAKKRAKRIKAFRTFTRSEMFGSPVRLDNVNDVADRIMRILPRRQAGRIYVYELRAKLSGVSRADFDRAMLLLQRQGKIALFPLDNPRDRTVENRAGAVYVAGTPHEVFYVV